MESPSSLSIETLPYRWPVPAPFLFNTLKHHHHHAIKIIRMLKSSEINVDTAREILVKTGRCMIDFYHGSLGPDEIVEEISIILREMALFDPDKLRIYIQSCPGKYFNLTLSDQSLWTILLGRQNDSYIHIHPARGSSHVLRISALVLRTAIFLRAFYSKDQDLVSNVNLVRIKILAEPPIKNITYTKNLQRLMERLRA